MAQDVTYADLKFSRSPPGKGHQIPSEGTDVENLTYENVEASGRPGRKGPGSPKQKGGAKRLPWPVALGLAGASLLLLLATLIGLGVHHWLGMRRQLEEARADLNHTRAALMESSQKANETLTIEEEERRRRETMLNATWAEASKDRCPKDWVLYQEKCLFFSTERKTWPESKEACEQQSACLLITKSWQLGLLARLLDCVEHWVGLSGTWNGRRRTWILTWVNGSKYESADFQAYGYSTSGTCGTIRGGQLFMYNCDYHHPYICERPVRPTQPGPF